MILYTARKIVNPRIIDIVLYEKNFDIPRQIIDYMAGENRQSDFLKINPAGQIPALQLDDGTVIAEVPTICEYIEEICPTPIFVGSTAQERAETRMWMRRIDLEILEPMVLGFRYGEGEKYFTKRITVYPEVADSLKDKGQRGLIWINQMLNGKMYLCGDRITYVDIILYCFLEFIKTVGQPIAEELTNIHSLIRNVAGRESAINTR